MTVGAGYPPACGAYISAGLPTIDLRVTSVIVTPDYTQTNPYQQLLSAALRDRGVDVTPADRHGPFLPWEFLTPGQPDVVHFHWLHPYLLGRNAVFTFLKGFVFLVQVLLLQLLGVRVVWTAHNLTEHNPRNPRIERALKHLTVRMIDVVIVHCESVEDRLLETYWLPERYRHRLSIVPHGHYRDTYENDVSRERAREELGLDDEFTFLFFGRVCEYKNVTGLIEAFAGIDAPNARLIVAGNPRDEDIRNRVERAAACDDRVRTSLEFIPEARVQYYMNAADVVTLPFEEIVTSGSAILAMSFANPVVVPDVGCITSVVPEDGGFTYPDDGSEALAAALERTMDADLDAVGNANLAAVDQFDWARIADETADLYAAR